MISYPILLDDKIIGDAQIKIEGLYYRITCQCKLPDEKPWRVVILCDDTRIDLGICVRIGQRRGMKVRIPVKNLPLEKMSFFAFFGGDRSWYPVVDDEPFPYITQLETLRFAKRNGAVGLEITG